LVGEHRDFEPIPIHRITKRLPETPAHHVEAGLPQNLRNRFCGAFGVLLQSALQARNLGATHRIANLCQAPHSSLTYRLIDDWTAQMFRRKQSAMRAH
jgi:hypothetical protein